MNVLRSCLISPQPPKKRTEGRNDTSTFPLCESWLHPVFSSPSDARGRKDSSRHLRCCQAARGPGSGLVGAEGGRSRWEEPGSRAGLWIPIQHRLRCALHGHSTCSCSPHGASSSPRMPGGLGDSDTQPGGPRVQLQLLGSRLGSERGMEQIPTCGHISLPQRGQVPK